MPCYMVGHDPVGNKIGSGGGVLHLLKALGMPQDNEPIAFINAGGESRRLPAYAPYGKVLLPLPIIKKSRGQKLDQRLLDLQQDYLSRIIEYAPSKYRVIVASGDCYIQLPPELPMIPDADIVCLGIKDSPEIATKHGVFVCDSASSGELLYMLQKPSLEQLKKEVGKGDVLIDSGVWLMSGKAIKALSEFYENIPNGYLDLYSDWGKVLGKEPTEHAPVSSQLKVAVWVPEGATFYHFGSTEDLVRSMHKLQNSLPAGGIEVRGWESHRSVFALNAQVKQHWTEHHSNIWIENSYIPETWHLSGCNVLTGIPQNQLTLQLPKGTCIDVQRQCSTGYYILRVYGYTDTFRGAVNNSATTLCGEPVVHFLQRQNLKVAEDDIYKTAIHPVVRDLNTLWQVLQDLVCKRPVSIGIVEWLSPEEVMKQADLTLAEQQRATLLKSNILQMYENFHRSVIFQSDLIRVAELLQSSTNLPSSEAFATEYQYSMQDAMLRGYMDEAEAEAVTAARDWYEKANHYLYKWMSPINSALPTTPKCEMYPDQIIWARSPVRIDVAGGWTDTPPYCLYEGGNVLNLAILVNGQEPIQVYIKRTASAVITLHSIDLGKTEVVSGLEQLQAYNKVGDPFSIVKAALQIAGITGTIAQRANWTEGINRLGGGIEITQMSALPAGSGLGVSSILAATILSALSECYGLEWSAQDVGQKVTLLEQRLTTGGGWQDQYGALFGGVKTLTTQRGTSQAPDIVWLPDTLFVDPQYAPCHLLFYTGQTRVAKHILSNIVRDMALNRHETIQLLSEMKQHTQMVAEAVSKRNWKAYGEGVGKSLLFNTKLDSGTLTPEINRIIKATEDLVWGCKLPGAGGGGFVYLVAKNAEVVPQIKERVEAIKAYLPPTSRWVDMQIAPNGIKVTKS